MSELRQGVMEWVVLLGVGVLVFLVAILASAYTCREAGGTPVRGLWFVECVNEEGPDA